MHSASPGLGLLDLGLALKGDAPHLQAELDQHGTGALSDDDPIFVGQEAERWKNEGMDAEETAKTNLTTESLFPALLPAQTKRH